MTRINLSLLFIFFILFSNAQQAASGPQMADKFREDGKIYIVITVIAMIFAAIVIFLTLLERKVRRLENQLKEDQSLNNKN